MCSGEMAAKRARADAPSDPFAHAAAGGAGAALFSSSTPNPFIAGAIDFSVKGVSYTAFFDGTCPLSNWHMDAFEMGRHTMRSGEHALMAAKCAMFEMNDKKIAAMVARATCADVKAAGKKVKGYNEAKWARRRLPVMTAIAIHKFSETKMRWLLQQTGDATLVEASRSDRIWGVGAGMGDVAETPVKGWGDNLLGKALMAARAHYNMQDALVQTRGLFRQEMLFR